jgi:peptide/nickel transport system substrate-binding protein
MTASRRSLMTTAAAATLVGLSTTPGRAAGPSVLKVIPQADLRVLDPHLSGAQITKMHGALVYETLLTWDSKLNVRPMAAESYTVSSDRLVYRFTLRAGMLFHDGQPVRSRDVVASLKRWMAKDASGGRLAAQIAAYDIESDIVFSLRLKAPYPWVEYTLGAVGAILPQIMRERDAQTDPNKAVTDIIGSGPFRFVASEWVPGSLVVYEKNPDYIPRSEPPDGLAGARIVEIDRLEWHVIPDAATAAAALIAGEMDFWDTVPIDLLPTLRRSPDVIIDRLLPLPSVGTIRMNQSEAPFDNVLVRRAVAKMVDQTEFMQAAVGDPAWFSPCHSFFVCGSPNETLAGSEPYAQSNLDEARRMLAASGYNGQPVVVIGTDELPPIGGMTAVLARRMSDIGFNVDLRMMAWGQMTSVTSKYPSNGSWNIYASYGTGASLHQPLTNQTADTTCGSRALVGGACDDEASALKTSYLAQTEPGAKRVALDALQQRLWQVIPYIPAGQFASPFAWRRTLAGFAPTPLQIFWNVTKSA